MMDLSKLEIESLFHEERYEELLASLRTRKDSISRFYFVRSLICLNRYKEVIDLLGDFGRPEKFNMTLASLLLQSLLAKNEVEQLTIYWPILKEPLIQSITNPPSQIQKDWILETFATSFYLMERYIQPTIHTLNWLEKQFRRELTDGNHDQATKVIEVIFSAYGDAHSVYWMAKAQLAVSQHLFYDAKNYYRRALDYFDHLHSDMYLVFNFVLQFFGIEELRQVFLSKSHLFDDLIIMENSIHYNKMLEIRTYLKSDSKGYFSHRVNIQENHPIVQKGGAPSYSKSIISTFEILESSFIPRPSTGRLQNTVLYGIDEYANSLFFTEPRKPKIEIRDSAFAKDFIYNQVGDSLFQVPISTYRDITVPAFRHLFIASPGRVGSTLLHRILRLAGIESISETRLTFNLANLVFRGQISAGEANSLSKLDSFLLFEDEVPPVVVKKLPAQASLDLIDILDNDDQVVFLYRNIHDWILSRMRMNTPPDIAINQLINTLTSHSIILKEGFLGGVLWYEDMLNSSFVQLEEIFGELRKLEWQIPLEDSQAGTPLSREILSSNISHFEMDDYLRTWKASPGPVIAKDLGLTRLEMPTTEFRTSMVNSLDSLRTRVVPANILGDVDHFYHFLFGLILPFLVSQKEFLLQGRYLFPDVGPMNRHLSWLTELGINIRVASQDESGAQVHSEISCIGWDHPSAYEFGEFELARDTLLELMQFAKPNPNLEPRVLIIDRGLANYDNRKRKSNGISRRSIPNLPALHSELSSVENVQLVVLEDVSLESQIKLFSNADVIIAQHGAALANLVWCKPGTSVIEIIDPQIRPPYFEALAQRLDLNYISILQAHNHEDIDIDSVKRIILKRCREYKLRKGS